MRSCRPLCCGLPGSINSGNTSTASGFNDGSTSTSAVTSKLTAYGYCIKK